MYNKEDWRNAARVKLIAQNRKEKGLKNNIWKYRPQPHPLSPTHAHSDEKKGLCTYSKFVLLPVHDDGRDLLIHEDEDGGQQSGDRGSQGQPPRVISFCGIHNPVPSLGVSWLVIWKGMLNERCVMSMHDSSNNIGYLKLH